MMNTPGGGSGAAVYNDGNTCHLDICGTAIPPYSTIDADADNRIGLAEVISALKTIAADKVPELSVYARMIGDIDYDHRIDLADVIVGLELLGGGGSM